MGEKLDKKLNAVWDKAGVIGGPPPDLSDHRYVAQALDNRTGYGWGVYDRLRERFLNDKEVLATTTKDLASGIIRQ